jgi:exodeoxyribonuclease-3
MKIATWNVNGFRARERQFTEWMAEERPDVVCLQEIKASVDQIADALFLLPDYWSYWHGGAGGYSGVSLHLRKQAFSAEPRFSHPPFDHEHRIVEASVGDLSIASVYVPNGGKDFAAKMTFLERMSAYVAEQHAAGRRLLVAGDLNVTRDDRDLHPSQRKPGAIGQRPDERAAFAGLFTAGLVDVVRAMRPDDPRFFTWWPYWKNARERNLGWRIDYVLASEPLSRGATTCAVRRDVGTSDHAPVVVELADP